MKAEATYESLLISGFAKKTPPDLAKIEAAAKRMMKSGSAKEIDKLIQKLPDTTKHDVLKTLAKERFGIELKTDTGDTETKSAKAHAGHDGEGAGGRRRQPQPEDGGAPRTR